MKEFETCMELNTDLSTKSIKKYLQAIKTIDEELMLKNMVQLGLGELRSIKELEELKIQYFEIPEFKDKDLRGNRMYSAAFNKYIAYKDNQKSTPVSLEGIVYILSNPSLPGLVKIGQTVNLQQRLSNLFNTSVPTPFKCVYAKKVQKIRTCFFVAANQIADAEKKTIYLQVIDGDGELVFGTDVLNAITDDSIYSCTSSSEFQYRNIEMNHCFEWERVQVLSPGRYQINLIIEGDIATQKNFKLR